MNVTEDTNTKVNNSALCYFVDTTVALSPLDILKSNSLLHMYRVKKKKKKTSQEARNKLIDNIIRKSEILSLLCTLGTGLYNAPKVFLDSFKNSHKNLSYNHFQLY